MKKQINYKWLIVSIILILIMFYHFMFIFRTNKIVVTNEFYNAQVVLEEIEVRQVLLSLIAPPFLIPTGAVKSEYYLRFDFYNHDILIKTIYAVEDSRTVRTAYAYRNTSKKFVRVMKKIIDKYKLYQ